MSAEAKSSLRRVIVLSGDPRLTRELAGPASASRGCQAVSGPYEAAAELLADPPDALVIDLRVLEGRHLRLLEIARRTGAEVLGVGPLPSWASSEELSGMRLVARSDLAREIGRIAPRQAGAGADAEAAQKAPPVAKPVPGAEQPRRDEQVRAPLRAGATAEQERSLANRTAPAGGTRSVLTSEELAALLGDES